MRRAVAAMALIGGVLAAFAGTPFRAPELDVTHLAAAVQAEEDHVTAVELAQWIRDRKPGLRILDLRTPAEFAKARIPTSENLSLPQLMKTDFGPSETLVLVSDGGAHAAQGWVLMQARGYAKVYFLRGGVREWNDDILNAARPTPLTRYFGGARRDGC